MISKYATIQPAHIANVTRIIHMATPEQYAAGRVWYRCYGTEVGDMAIAAGLTATQGCYLFAALSPQMPIVRNVNEYRRLLETMDAWTIGHTGTVKYQCAGILAGYLDYLSGVKVRSFARNLSGDMSCVTVDRHAASMVYNAPMAAVGGPDAYRYCERVIQAAAIVLDLAPAEVQAIGWIVWRANKGILDAPLYPGSLAEPAAIYTADPKEANRLAFFGTVARGAWQRDVLYSMLSAAGCDNPITALRGRAASYGMHYQASLDSLLWRCVDAGITVTVVSGPHGGMHAATYFAASPWGGI